MSYFTILRIWSICSLERFWSFSSRRAATRFCGLPSKNVATRFLMADLRAFFSVMAGL